MHELNQQRKEIATRSKMAGEDNVQNDDVSLSVGTSIDATKTASNDGEGNNTSSSPQQGKPATQPEDSIAVLSKKQRKRLLKVEKLKAKKQKIKEEKRAKAIAEGRDLDAERKLQEERTASGHRKRWLEHLWNEEKLPLAKKSFQICVDCSFESLMREREIASLAQQIRYCYSYNKRSPNPSLVAITDVQENDETMALLKREAGFSEWGNRLFTVTSKSLPQYYSSLLSTSVDQKASAQDDSQWKSRVVYLTSDSPNVLEHLENDKVYVIGGIVDRNRLKRTAIERAEALGVGHGKLPLDAHFSTKNMTSTKVLTCNHVFDILLKYRQHGNDWSRALEDVLPTRKEPAKNTIEKPSKRQACT